MTVLRALRKLILGETWTVPLGVAAVLGLATAVRAADASAFEHVGGFVVLAGVVVVLVLAVSSTGRRTAEPRHGVAARPQSVSATAPATRSTGTARRRTGR